jgi:hypothetical protein
MMSRYELWSSTDTYRCKSLSQYKDGYSSIEVYNSGQEDLEQFQILIKWKQTEGEQERFVV